MASTPFLFGAFPGYKITCYGTIESVYMQHFKHHMDDFDILPAGRVHRETDLL